MDTIVIATPGRGDMAAGAALLSASLGFSGDDAVPAWLMAATDGAGGLTLAAFDGGAVVGWSYAFAGWDGGAAFLFSCGLAVASGHRCRGVGRRLKLAQRDRARERGYGMIRWTADPLAAPALRLYLSGLGARLTGYHAGLFDGLREGAGIPQDDVDIVWALDGGAPSPRPGETERVEIPADRAALGAREHLAWRLAVRERFGALLADGHAGVAVERDAGSGRCWVVFERAV